MKNKDQKTIGFETYGKQSTFQRIYNQIKWRFKVSRHTQNLLHTKDITYYIPRLNKYRFGLAIFASVVLIILPAVTLLAIPTMLWGIK